MPSNLDFDTTKKFRDRILGKTLQRPNGPQTFKNDSYIVQKLSDSANIDQDSVDTNRSKDLSIPNKSNTYKPEKYFVQEEILTLPRKANLKLYPSFTQSDYGINKNKKWNNISLVGVLTNSNYETESDLYKFASNRILKDTDGPIFTRSAQYRPNNSLDNLNSVDLTNIINGRQPLIQTSFKITNNDQNLEFLNVVANPVLQLPTIPGDYLTDPSNPLNYNPRNSLQVGTLINDAVGAIASMIGIRGKPKISPRPSDILIQYMGEGQKSILFDLLSYSRYAPNYTILSTVNNFIQNQLQINLPIQVPGNVYIGDDRYTDVKYTISDFFDRHVQSAYNLTKMFDPTAAKLLHSEKNISEGGEIGGKLIWISKKSKNKIGANNKEYEAQSSNFESGLSTNFRFRGDSILGKTQQLLNSLPPNGSARSHVANVIDQTSRVFKEGDLRLSRGSAVKYTDKFSGEESGVEYARVWTKDRPYMTYGSSMPLESNQKDINTKKYKSSSKKYRRGNIRKFNSSVLDDTWNLNMAPMSNGKKSFDSSTNIVEKNRGNGDFYAKKYMFSIENLAWKSSNVKGFQVSDLPACERGNNGGRVMWFPPYDLKMSEQNNAKWEPNSFVGRPEPIYTYQNTERTGQVSFKVVVDHPSIMNLLVREHFKGMSDEESDNYINAFFAGVQDVDFYSLIQTYTTLDSEDRLMILQYLNAGVDKETITKIGFKSDPLPTNTGGDTDRNEHTNFEWNQDNTFYFDNNLPGKKNNELTVADSNYGALITSYTGRSSDFTSRLTDVMTNATLSNSDKLLLIDTTGSTTGDVLTNTVSNLSSGFTELNTNFTELNKQLNEIKNVLSGKTLIGNIEIKIFTSTSEAGDDKLNFYLGIRRIDSLMSYIVNYLESSLGNISLTPTIANYDVAPYLKNGLDFGLLMPRQTLKSLGYDIEGDLIFNVSTLGENAKLANAGGKKNVNCGSAFNNTELRIVAPIAFFCREGKVKINYTKSASGRKEEPKKNVPPITKLVITKDTIDVTRKKPPIDVMKRIIMKTLSECFYFKKLEEDSPLAFKSLTEKLKYFHPAFHSTTPEGLNSRLTFLLQCVRPGDTIPIKGISDVNDLNARNTSFGPPPVCVLRIGDFYHSKILIKDVNITFEEGVWDLNPEGIGVQPMIANVQLQITFIGGQGLDKPVEKLQNALSSNFFANTEMYDERSIATDGRIANENKDKFTREFLETLQKNDAVKTAAEKVDPNKHLYGKYIGAGKGTALYYTSIINELFTKVGDYTSKYKSTYENVYKEYGTQVTGMFFSSTYRTTNTVDVNGYTPSTINMLGEYQQLYDIPYFSDNFKNALSASILSLPDKQLTDMMGFDITDTVIAKEIENVIKPIIVNIVSKKIDELSTLKSIKELETTRNEVVLLIDKLNYVVSISGDTKIDGITLTKTTLTGFVASGASGFTSNYNGALQYLITFNSSLTNLYDPSFDFNNLTTIDPTYIKSILQLYLNGRKSDIFDPLEKAINLITDQESGYYMLQNFTTGFDSFLNTDNSTTLTINTAPTRTNSNEIFYETSTPTIVEDSTKTDAIFKIFSSKNKLESGHLNFYR